MANPPSTMLGPLDTLAVTNKNQFAPREISRRARGTFGLVLVLAGPAGLAACGSSSAPGGTGGAVSSGGQVANVGGASGGGATESGGAAASGGATASGGETSSGGSNPNELPPDSTQASIEAFLAADTYKSWTHDAAPRDAIDATNPHLSDGGPVKLQVYFNSAAVESIATNDGKPLLEVNHTVGSMVVKEIYGDAGTRIGRGVSIKTGTDRRGFTFYCEGSVEACAVGEAPPIYGSSNAPCSGCHGGSIFAPPPTP